MDPEVPDGDVGQAAAEVHVVAGLHRRDRVRGGAPAATGLTDAVRQTSGELVYTGYTRTAVMGAEQAAGTMAIVMEASARDRGLEPDRAQIDGMRAKIVETFDRQTSAFYTSGRLLDDGIIDPRDTRGVLTQVLQLFRRADGLQLRPLTFGVARP